MRTTLLSLAAAALLPAAALAQSNPAAAYLNEIYASHSGTDDQEMIEIIATPGASLTGYVVCIVEGEGPGTNQGTLDRAFDLTGLTVPPSGFFVLGNTAVGPDLDIGPSNVIENGTETFYLIFTSNPTAITSLVGTDVDADDDLVTDLGALGTIVDKVAMVDTGYLDTLDNAMDDADAIGPDGSFFPAGIFRAGDWPNRWSATFLDFSDTTNQNEPRTPGAPNTLSGIRLYGSPDCAGANGRMHLTASGDTTSGTGTLTFDISNGPDNGGAGGAPALLFIGAGDADITFASGCEFLINLGLPTLQIPVTLDTTGGASFGPAPVPPGLTGLKLYAQALSVENGAFRESNGVELEFF